MKHTACLRWALLAAAVVLAVGSIPALGDEPPPSAVQDTGLDLLGWLVGEFGYPGVATFVAWQARTALQRLSSVAPPLVVQLHPDDRRLLTRLARLVTESDESDESEPKTKTR